MVYIYTIKSFLVQHRLENLVTSTSKWYDAAVGSDERIYLCPSAGSAERQHLQGQHFSILFRGLSNASVLKHIANYKIRVQSFCGFGIVDVHSVKNELAAGTLGGTHSKMFIQAMLGYQSFNVSAHPLEERLPSPPSWNFFGRGECALSDCLQGRQCRQGYRQSSR